MPILRLMHTYSVSQIRQERVILDIVRHLASGKRVFITRRGKVVGMMTPVPADAKKQKVS